MRRGLGSGGGASGVGGKGDGGNVVNIGIVCTSSMEVILKIVL